MKKTALTRILCALLCAVLLSGTFAMSASAIPPTAGTPASVQKVTGDDPGFFRRGFDFLFRTFGLLGFIWDPYQFTMINQKPVFQFALGFNDFYGVFPWAVNVWADEIITEFNYGGKDWRIQFWKGGYGVFLATGGEIGIYVKDENMPLKHYNASLNQNDWLNLRYTIYNRGKELFTRPSPYLTGDVGPYWWAPGYKFLSICTDFILSPRKNVVMDATVEFKDDKMAKLFIKEMEAKGFTELKQPKADKKAKEPPAKLELGLNTPEKYQLCEDGKSVRFVWQNINEGIF